MKKLCFILIISFCFSCVEFNQNQKSPEDFIPNDFQTLYKINNLQDFELFIEKNPFSNYILKFKNDSIKNILNHLSPHSPLYIIKSNSRINDYTFLTNYHNMIIKKDS